MKILYSDCDGLIEQGILITVFSLLMLTIVAALNVATNELEESEKPKIPWWIWLTGGFEVLFTGRFLNEKGKKWRLVLVGALTLLVV